MKFWILLLGLVLVGCSPKPVAPQITCNQPLQVEFLKNEIQNTFYPSSKWEQAQDLLSPSKGLKKYGMNFRSSVRLRNLNNADLQVQSSLSYLIIKNENMDPKTFQAVLPAFRIAAKSDTVVNFFFAVDIQNLTEDYFKLIVLSEKVGYFSKSFFKYSLDSNEHCAAQDLMTHGSNASDSVLRDYVSIPEITDATYNGALATSEATVAVAKWSIDNPEEIKCGLFVLVLIIGIFLGGHAGNTGC